MLIFYNIEEKEWQGEAVERIVKICGKEARISS